MIMDIYQWIPGLTYSALTTTLYTPVLCSAIPTTWCVYVVFALQVKPVRHGKLIHTVNIDDLEFSRFSFNKASYTHTLRRTWWVFIL